MVEICNYIGDFLEHRGKTDIAEKFQLNRFSMKLQALERTYIDKVFALCDYYLQGKSKRYSRHLYDIYKLTPMMEFNDDFQAITSYFAADFVPYEDVIRNIRQLAESGFFRK